MTQMTELEKRILSAMTETGRAVPGWRFKIQATENNPGSDWATVTGVLIKKRCRKPFMAWELAVYMPKAQIFWDKSKFVKFSD